MYSQRKFLHRYGFPIHLYVTRINVISYQKHASLFKKRQQFVSERTLSHKTKIKFHQSLSAHNKSQENTREKLFHLMENGTFSIILKQIET